MSLVRVSRKGSPTVPGSSMVNLAGVETLVQSPASRMVTRETPAAKAVEAATPQREPRDMCLSNTENFPYPRRNGFSTDMPMLPIVTPQKKRSHLRSI